jgi:hypothetical protein
MVYDLSSFTSFEFRIVAELLEQLSIILHQSNNDTRKHLIVLDASVLLIRVLLGVLISYIRRNLVWDVGLDQFPNAIGVLPSNVAEEIVEAPDDVRKQVKLWFRLVPAAISWNRVNLRILIQLNALCGLFLDPIAIHVDRFENAFGEIFLAWRGQLRQQEIQEYRKLFPIRVCVG